MRVESIPCLVTGASAGIGMEVAKALARRGCRVALVARRRDQLEEVAERVCELGGVALVLPADVSDALSLGETVKEAAARLGALRLVVANAGIGVHGAGATLPYEDVRRVFEVNALGVIATVRAAVPFLLSGAPSALVAVSSLSGLIPYRGGGAYGATKAAIIQYLRCLRLEMAGRRVSVGWLCPGPVATALIEDRIPTRKLPRLARLLVPVLAAPRVAAAVVRLAEGRGGQKVVPARAAAFAALARHFPRLAERLEILTGAGDC
jgi:short-subunit dehydrogenase